MNIKPLQIRPSVHYPEVLNEAKCLRPRPRPTLKRLERTMYQWNMSLSDAMYVFAPNNSVTISVSATTECLFFHTAYSES